MGEFTYTSAETQTQTFVYTKLTWSNITFSKRNQHAILRLQQSKTDVNYTGVKIILTATNDKRCLVNALHILLIRDPQPYIAFLFCLTSYSSMFVRKLVIYIFQERLQVHNIITVKTYTGHSFRNSVAQHVSDNSMLDQNIQKLGHWTLRTVQLYFETSISFFCILNIYFQTRQTLSFNQPTLPPALSLYNYSPTSSTLSYLGQKFSLTAWWTFSPSA